MSGEGEGGNLIFSEAPDLDGMTPEELAKQAVFYGLKPDASSEEIIAEKMESITPQLLAKEIPKLIRKLVR